MLLMVYHCQDGKQTITLRIDPEMYPKLTFIQTPHLEFAYKPRDFTAMREMGASWKIITEDIPEPKGITLHGIDS